MSQAINQTSYYTLANIIRHMTSLIMLPIYTRFLTPADYGIIELMTMALDLVGILVCNRIGEAIFRYYSLAPNQTEKKITISTAFVLGILINTIGFCILLLTSGKISAFISEETNFQLLFILFAITLIFEAIINIPIIYLRLQNLAKYYLIVSVAKLSIQITLNIYFVVIQDLHVAGVVYSALISNLIMGFILGGYFLSRNGIHFNPQVAYKIVVFSIPMIAVTAASFVTTFGDRYFLKTYTSLDEVGIYSLAYKFGFIFMALSWDPFFKYWEGQRYKVYRQENAAEDFQKSFVFLSLWLLSLGTLISVFLSDALIILSDEKFHSAADYAPLIILAYIFYAWSHYCDFGIFLKEKTRYMAYTESASAVVILLLYITMIPELGTYGAALATAIGYFLRFLILTLVSFRLYPMTLPWGRVCLLLGVCCVTVLTLKFDNLTILLAVPIKMLALITLFAIVYRSPLITYAERTQLRNTAEYLMTKLNTRRKFRANSS